METLPDTLLAPPREPDEFLAEGPAYGLIELFFFAYRDFVGDPDRILDEFGFGRAHHRVLHFVDRTPGLTIAELLRILKITKQSLNRVLKELIDKGFIDSRTGTEDRRQRHLHATSRGHDLAVKLAKLQTRRIMRALRAMPGGSEEVVTAYLVAMIDAEDRDHVAAVVAGGKAL